MSKAKSLSYLDSQNLKSDCNTLLERRIPFSVDGMTISVPVKHAQVLSEFTLAHFTRQGDTISITNNDGEFFGHDKSQPLTCPKQAADLLHKAQEQNRSWYYVINHAPKRITSISEIEINKEYMIKGQFHKSPELHRCLGNYGSGDGEKIYMTRADSGETPESMAEKFANDIKPNCFVLWDFMIVKDWEVREAK